MKTPLVLALLTAPLCGVFAQNYYYVAPPYQQAVAPVVDPNVALPQNAMSGYLNAVQQGQQMAIQRRQQQMMEEEHQQRMEALQAQNQTRHQQSPKKIVPKKQSSSVDQAKEMTSLKAKMAEQQKEIEELKKELKKTTSSSKN